MISDTLAEAVQEIDRYLTDPAFQGTYQGAQRTRILLVTHAMEDLRRELDELPIEHLRRNAMLAIADLRQELDTPPSTQQEPI